MADRDGLGRRAVGAACDGLFRSRAAGLSMPSVFAAIALLFATGLPLSVAPAIAAPDDATCLTCHASPDLGSATVDTLAIHASVHARLACASCHTGVTGIPHAAKLPRARCESCHGAVASVLARSAHGAAGAVRCTDCHGTHTIRPAKNTSLERCGRCHANESTDYRASVHGVALANGDRDASTCADCHGVVHSIRAHGDSTSTVSRGRLAETCGRCHADRALMAKRGITIPEAYQLFRQSVHGRSRRAEAAVCSDCHASHRLRRANDPSSSIYRANIPTTCGRCHRAQNEKYAEGVHGTALARGVTAAPVCTDCHGEHLIRGPRDIDSPVASGNVSETCSRCHEATGIRETYGLPAGRLSTYRDSFHGLAARGGSPVVANCASCHGYHDILPSSDPRSAIAPARLPTTCGRCHPGAGARFAMGGVHVAMTTPDQPLLFWVRRVYLALIVLTISGMAFHQALDFGSKLRRHFSAHLGRLTPHTEAVKRWYVRLTLFERVQHVLLAASFFTLVYTGFALKFPEAWPFAWLARLEGGYRWRSVIHRGAAVAMVATSFVHLGYLATRRGREALRAMLPGPADATQAIANVLYLAGLRRAPPAFDRFSYIEKAEYWALIWGTVVMSATGLVLWFENASLRWLSKWVLDLATVVHYYEAWLAFLAIVVWHLYPVMMNPDVYPMNWTWLTGRISEQQLRHEHPAEWARIAAAEAAAALPEGPPAAKDAPPHPEERNEP